jgi:predicted extracellular nuclease
MSTGRTILNARRVLTAAACALVVVLGGAMPAAGAPTELFFSEYIEGTSNNKALEIYNGTGAAIDLAANGYSVQMFFNGSGTAGLTINLTGTVAAGDVFVLAQASASAAILAQADQTNGAGWFNGDDAVTLRKGTTVIDSIGQIGNDPGTEWGTGLTSTADNTLRRKAAIEAGDTTPDNAFDPAVEWDGFATDTFDGLGAHGTPPGDAAPSVTSTTPANGASGVALGSNISLTFSEPVGVAGNQDWFSISCTTSGAHGAAFTGGGTSWTLDPHTDFASQETCTVTVFAAGVTDNDTNDPPDNMAADHVFSFTTEFTLPLTEIAHVQGAGHLSPFTGNVVKVEGVVIAERGSNVWIQDPTPDADPATSEALLVFGSSVASAVVVGDHVHVTGTVTEFRGGCTPSCDPGSSAFDNLTVTELTSPSLSVSVLGTMPLPAATVIGMGGRVPPGEVIDNDSTGNVETSGVFDPAQDGIDFYETLESMLVQVNNPVVVGPRANTFGEIFVLADDGAQGAVRTTRGGIVIRPGDFNPERIMLDDLFLPMPAVDVRDHFTTAATGVMTYDFANFKIAVTSALVPVDGGLEREVTGVPGANELAIATFNVENLDPSDVATMPRLASIVVNNLRSPDLIGIEEMQDNTGATNDGTTAANLSWQAFIDAIVAAGGPLYDYRQIDPQNNADGGQPGGNIRVGFLFRTDRKLQFIDRGAGDATTPTRVYRQNGIAHLTLSPGRVDPQNPAWEATRKPLAGEFKYRGRPLIAIVNHFSSKGGDDPLFGRHQPPVRSSEVARHQQAASVNAFVDEILAADARANVVVLGDINDFEFSETTQILTAGGVLTSLMETLPQAERYSYVFEGNSQVLDQILFSDNLLRVLGSYDVVHVNAEFADQASDHDPSVAFTEVRN